MRTSLVFFGALLSLAIAREARAADRNATPATFSAELARLAPGDTLHLSAGSYRHFTLNGLNGSASAWITITGPASGPPAIVEADPGPCCNTIEIVDSSFVALRRLRIDGKNVDGAFGVSAKSGVVHDIVLDSNEFVNHRGTQQNTAISTKVTTWGWVIRGNHIDGVGTGVYLGNSNGAAPFIGGLIEGNVIENPIGYCMQIKFQTPRTPVTGMPTAPTSTIIRRNVFVKNDDPSPDGDRPNVLVGGFPDTGPGSEDRYEIYGNVFVHNPRESLLQASGRVTIHDNLFVDAPGRTAVMLQDHDLPLKQAFVYDNTIYAVGTGIQLRSRARQADAVVSNAIFADVGITGSINDQRENLVDSVAAAPGYVTRPSTARAAMDFYPLPGKCKGPAVDPAVFSKDTDFGLDFNGTSRGRFEYRGAFAGEGKNPGPTDGGAPLGPGMDGGSVGDGGAPSGGAAPGAASSDGCGCRVAGAPGGPLALLSLGAAAFAAIARRRARRG